MGGYQPFLIVHTAAASIHHNLNHNLIERNFIALINALINHYLYEQNFQRVVVAHLYLTISYPRSRDYVSRQSATISANIALNHLKY